MTGARRHGAVMGNSAKLSAVMLALIAAGASAPVLMDQFLDEKEGNSLTAYRDGSQGKRP
jgi:lysozyme